MELDDYEVHANNIEDEKDNENQNDEGPQRPGKKEMLNKGKAVGGRDRVLKYTGLHRWAAPTDATMFRHPPVW